MGPDGNLAIKSIKQNHYLTKEFFYFLKSGLDSCPTVCFNSEPIIYTKYCTLPKTLAVPASNLVGTYTIHVALLEPKCRFGRL